MATRGASSATRLITDSAFFPWKPPSNLLMGEEVLKLQYTKGLSSKKNEIILNVFLQGINIRLQKKMANLGKMNPKQ